MLSRGVPILFIVRDPSIGGVPILNGMAQLIQCIEFVKYIFAFVTQVAQSKDLVFLDSSSNMEEYNLHVFIMVAHSVCGALPLGIIVTSDEKEQTLVDALQLYKSSMPDFGFYGASLSGPRIFMTDNCYELREALKKSGPKQQQLCISMFFNRYSQYFYCFSLYSLLVPIA